MFARRVRVRIFVLIMRVFGVGVTFCIALYGLNNDRMVFGSVFGAIMCGKLVC